MWLVAPESMNQGMEFLKVTFNVVKNYLFGLGLVKEEGLEEKCV